VKKYGREAVAKAVAIVPLPRGSGNPGGRRTRDDDYDIAHCIHSWSEEHRASGSKKPVEDAIHDLYDLLIDQETQRQPGQYSRWRKTVLRKRSNERRKYLDQLALAEKLDNQKKMGARSIGANKLRSRPGGAKARRM